MAGAAHLVEGTPNGLAVRVFEPAEDAGLRPVLLIHGFASSTELNWVATGWTAFLNDAGRRAIAVDLPGHGAASAPEELDAYTPSRIRADLLQVLEDQGVLPLDESDPSSGVDVVGYSLGARLAWELAATQPELVRRAALGGPAAVDPLAAFDLAAAQRHLADGTPIADESTAELLRMARLVPSNDLFALMSLVEAVKSEPFDPGHAVPRQPLLLVAGDRDELAETMPRLAGMARDRGGDEAATELLLPARTHANAVTSRAFKKAAVEFLAS
ncbi:alpha/beta fold hydrolase [Zafaria sp. Z1313]|uniref:alpha/beta fold hydrolase n=1 Tax=unclassified Zafaria TaxID=2828765 RepID=UPI002E794572|nr:alpha/beta fold hydrolase [Zafaria sp. J156]MEE1620804.1 alpha/beta fold hydrolase [Zafaria sp. J156]